jgi:hypothetical protein
VLARELCLGALLTSLACAADPPTSTQAPGDGAPAVAASDVADSGGAAFTTAIVRTAAEATDVQTMKIRIGADGRVLKQSVYHGDASAIPEPVRALAQEQFPGAKALRYETEHYADLGAVYEVEVESAEGKLCEVAAKADGSLVYIECQEDPGSASDAIRSAIEAAIPGATIKELETKKGPNLDEVSVEVEAGGREYALRMKPDGTVLEKRRRIPAIVEVPG